MSRRAAALVIGNEILTGKVVEANLPLLAKTLFELGIRLERVVICRDDLDTIVRDLDALRHTHDVVVTSGGVGPTHDDVTIPAIAKAFGVPIELDPDLAQRIRDHFGPRTTEGHLRMAEVPRGGRLLANQAVHWPVLAMDNVFVLPGVPEIFARKLEVVREALGAGAPYLSGAIYTRCDEGVIAALLARIEAEHHVLVGSYPRFDESDHSVKITFDATERGAIDRAIDETLRALEPGLVVRVVRAA
ncbi:MAG: competence/damage-inducible protein A [Sandaracinaceae bacterium]|nr:competence/damage-inducible protein A [Sandaracinaceae bacterium]